MTNHNRANINQTPFLVFFTMLSMAIVLCKGIFSYRLVVLAGHTIQAGQLIAPLWFLVSDMIAELYGYKIAMESIMAGFICQLLFTLASTWLINLPFPTVEKDIATAYHTVFADMWRVDFAALFAFLCAGYINVKLISKWRALVQGRYFWLRSIGSSGISELVFSFLATFFIQLGKHNINVIFHIMLASFILKIIYSVVLAFPANLIIILIRGDLAKKSFFELPIEYSQ